MTDYVQCELNNCGAVAALFALFGRTRVPDRHLPLLRRESWPAAGISRTINQIGSRLSPPGGPVAADWFGSTATVTTTGAPGGISLSELFGSHFEGRAMARITASADRSTARVRAIGNEILLEIMGELIAASSARCVIVSGRGGGGFHWQTYYGGGGTVSVHNGRALWFPDLRIGMGPGVVIVRGPAI